MALLIRPDDASKLLKGELNPSQIRMALQLTAVPWGFCYKNPGGQFTYIISKAKFMEYFNIREAE